jgi:hypothetical protein
MNGSKRQAPRFYPKLWEAFDADIEITAIVNTMTKELPAHHCLDVDQVGEGGDIFPNFAILPG